MSRTTNLATPDSPEGKGVSRFQGMHDARRLWWLPPLVSCVVMVPLLPPGAGVVVVMLWAGGECAGAGVPCTGDTARHIGAATELIALIFALMQWPMAYWQPMPQRVVMACVPPVLAIGGWLTAWSAWMFR